MATSVQMRLSFQEPVLPTEPGHDLIEQLLGRGGIVPIGDRVRGMAEEMHLVASIVAVAFDAGRRGLAEDLERLLNAELLPQSVVIAGDIVGGMELAVLAQLLPGPAGSAT